MKADRSGSEVEPTEDFSGALIRCRATGSVLSLLPPENAPREIREG